LKCKPKERKERLSKFCEKNIENYHRAKYFKIINKALNYASNKKNNLITVEKIDIYNNEVNYINHLNIDYQYKKLMFAFLVQMRLNKYVSEIKNQKEYISNYFRGGKSKYKSIKDMANVSGTIKINDDFIHTLSRESYKLITILYSGLIRLDFLDNCKSEGNVVIEIRDYENVGWCFDYYNHVDKVVLCDYCKQPFKQKHKNECYCKKHKEYQPMETKIIKCIGCGDDVKLSAKDNQTTRCEECYETYRKIYKAQKERERRQRLKNVDNTN